jgi:hypothetical protein
MNRTLQNFSHADFGAIALHLVVKVSVWAERSGSAQGAASNNVGSGCASVCIVLRAGPDLPWLKAEKRVTEAYGRQSLRR